MALVLLALVDSISALTVVHAEMSTLQVKLLQNDWDVVFQKSPFKSLDVSLLGHIKETLLVTISDRIANRDGWTTRKDKY